MNNFISNMCLWGKKYVGINIYILCSLYSELSQKTRFLQKQNAGFSAQIQRVTPTKPGLKKAMLSLCFGDFIKKII